MNVEARVGQVDMGKEAGVKPEIQYTIVGNQVIDARTGRVVAEIPLDRATYQAENVIKPEKIEPLDKTVEDEPEPLSPEALEDLKNAQETLKEDIGEVVKDTKVEMEEVNNPLAKALIAWAREKGPEKVQGKWFQTELMLRIAGLALLTDISESLIVNGISGGAASLPIVGAGPEQLTDMIFTRIADSTGEVLVRAGVLHPEVLKMPGDRISTPLTRLTTTILNLSVGNIPALGEYTSDILNPTTVACVLHVAGMHLKDVRNMHESANDWIRKNIVHVKDWFKKFPITDGIVDWIILGPDVTDDSDIKPVDMSNSKTPKDVEKEKQAKKEAKLREEREKKKKADQEKYEELTQETPEQKAERELRRRELELEQHNLKLAELQRKQEEERAKTAQAQAAQAQVV